MIVFFEDGYIFYLYFFSKERIASDSKKNEIQFLSTMKYNIKNINFKSVISHLQTTITMNVSIIYRMFQESESSGRYRLGGKKPINGDKRRRCEEYGLKKSNYVRRKQEKVRYDTWRREEIPNEEDEKLANIHYANFLGDKYGDHGAPYDASIVNTKFCDCMREEEHYDSLSEVSLGSTDSEEEFYEPVTLIKLTLQHPELLHEQSKREESRYQNLFDDMEITQTNKDSFAIVIKELEDSVYEDDEQVEENIDFFSACWSQENTDEQEYRIKRWSERQGKRAYDEQQDSQIMPMKKARCDDETFNV